ncbi:MAG: TerC family protein [Thermoanaerobaculaceae bacterium]|nr:TerC family protein [Thermoanaerobaculaceae bacterium]
MAELSWLVLAVVVGGLLTLDLVVFHRHAQHEGMRKAAWWSVFWVGIGLVFAVFVGFTRGSDAAFAYLTAFLIEKSLSVDNLFVFLALFTYFGIKPEFQHRVLFWGIVGALVTRGVFIVAGVALLETFHFFLYVLGALLIATGARLGLGEEGEVHPERNLVVRWASRVLPVARAHHGEKFVVRLDGVLHVTPMFLALLAIESTDVMFAVDSVPAVLAVSRDVFVVYSSNVFAVLGLRALYFVLAGALQALRFLRPALALILVLVGAKMLLADVFDVPTALSLVVVAIILAVATAASLLFPQRDSKPTAP